MSKDILNERLFNESINTLNYLRSTINTPFIILPTSKQLNMKKILTLMSSPILNFRLSNRLKNIHGSYGNPITEIHHDIIFHSNKTHYINKYINKLNLKMNNKINNKELKNILTNYPEKDYEQEHYNVNTELTEVLFKDIYKNRFDTINKIKPLFNEPKYSCIFFNIFHEKGFQDDNLTLSALIKSFDIFKRFIEDYDDLTSDKNSLLKLYTIDCDLDLFSNVSNFIQIFNELHKKILTFTHKSLKQKASNLFSSFFYS